MNSKLDELIQRREQTVLRIARERDELGALGAGLSQPVRAAQRMGDRLGKVTKFATTAAGIGLPILAFVFKANPAWRWASLGLAAATGYSKRNSIHMHAVKAAPQGGTQVKPVMKTALMAGAALAVTAGARVLWSRLGAGRQTPDQPKEAINRWEGEGGHPDEGAAVTPNIASGESTSASARL